MDLFVELLNMADSFLIVLVLSVSLSCCFEASFGDEVDKGTLYCTFKFLKLVSA